MADVVKGFRDAIQDLLVPELKAMRVEMGALKDGMKQNAQAIVELRREMNERFEKVDERFARMDERFTTVMAELAEMRGQMATTTKVLDRILDRVDLADRLSKLEERVSFVMDKIPA